ncbi:MAG: hypothetical protein PF961_10945 [Planctomycetota bacterium]|jgi:hypothetical protein|nr:hypothetical protein [Planctomycetota bacterium]
MAHDLPKDAVNLLPPPRSCEVLSGTAPVPSPLSFCVVDPALCTSVPGLEGAVAADAGWIRAELGAVAEDGLEAYHLAVRPEGVRIRAPSPTGLRWALTTLAQLLGNHPTAVP